MPNISADQTTLSQTPLAFHLLAKPTGAVCNLDCKYCFFLSKEMLYPGSRFRMADELLETYIRQLLESQKLPEVTIAFLENADLETEAMAIARFEQLLDKLEVLVKIIDGKSLTLPGLLADLEILIGSEEYRPSSPLANEVEILPLHSARISAPV